MSRREAVIYLNSNDQRAARTVIGRGIRKVLPYGRQRTAPFWVEYRPADKEYGLPGRYLLTVTDRELAAVLDQIEIEARAEGWDGSPAEAYHD